MAHTTRRASKPKVNRTAKRAATQAERDAIRFSAMKIAFGWTNEKWAATWAPWLRIAAATLTFNDDELQDSARAMAKDGCLSDTLEGLAQTKQHMEALVEGLDAALGRLFLVTERLGYSPENPPPERPDGGHRVALPRGA
jgi:hypothetical protein